MLVLLTVLSLLLGWQAKVIGDRRDVLARLRREKAPPLTLRACNETWQFPSWPYPDIPLWRKWLGDEAIRSIHLGPQYTEAEFRRVTKLFPEATVFHKLPAATDNMTAIGQRHTER